jgi:uncharacterized protein YbgA (DUF1722 family)/uncharacterized protein YbbK (DUF523 family)
MRGGDVSWPVAPLRVGISGCLLGHEVRYDGGHKRDPFLTDTLGRFVEWVPFCPEVELGLGIPREPIRLEGNPAAPRLVATRSGADLTAAMTRLARARAEHLARLDLVGYVLKKDSPSCGMDRVRVHGASGRPARRGTGLFARALMERLPLLPVEEEGRLNDPGLRENFIERLFAHARWKGALAAGMTRGRLVAFHTAHELLLLAHDPAAYRRLGPLVANAKRRPLAAVVADYGAGFMRALRARATPGRHANVLEHMLGHFSDRLTPGEREELVGAIEDHRRRIVPLVVPLTLVKHHVRRLAIESLAGQTYLDPHPKELMLRNHV